MNLALFGADHSPTAFGFDLAHGRVGLWHGVAHAVAVRHVKKRFLAVTWPIRIGSNKMSKRGSRDILSHRQHHSSASGSGSCLALTIITGTPAACNTSLETEPSKALCKVLVPLAPMTTRSHPKFSRISISVCAGSPEATSHW